MKQLFAGLITVLMMAAGLVTLSAATASAACPYTGCVQTSTRISAPNRVVKNRKARICARVGTAGNGRPRGRVSVSLVRAGGGYRWSNDRATGGRYRVCFSTPRLRKLGRYVVRARYDARADSAYRDSRDRDSLRVVRRRG